MTDYDAVYREKEYGAFPLRDYGRLVPSMLAGKTVLDLGCGVGHAARFMAGRGATVTGVDVSTVALDLAARLAPDIEWRTDIPARRFDYVVCLDTLEHIFPPAPTLCELAEKCDRGVFTVPNQSNPYHILGGTWQDEEARHIGAWKRLFRDCGWTVEAVGKDPGPEHRPWVKRLIAVCPTWITYQFKIETRARQVENDGN